MKSKMRRVLSSLPLCLALLVMAFTEGCPPNEDDAIPFALGAGFDLRGFVDTKVEPPSLIGTAELFELKKPCAPLDVVSRLHPLAASASSSLVAVRGLGPALLDEEDGMWRRIPTGALSRDMTAGVTCAACVEDILALGTDVGFRALHTRTGLVARYQFGPPPPPPPSKNALAEPATPVEPFVTAVIAGAPGSFLVGTWPRAAGVKLLNRCVDATSTCTPVAGSPSTLNQGDQALTLERFGSKVLLGSTLGVHVSSDGGGTFAPATGINGYGYQFAQIDGAVYVATQIGVFRSVDGSAWTAFSTGLPNPTFGGAILAYGGSLYATSNNPKPAVSARASAESSWHAVGGTIPTLVASTLAAGDKGIYVGTSGGVFGLRSGSFVPLDAGLEGHSSISTALAQDGRVLLGTEFGKHAVGRTTDDGKTWSYALDGLGVRSFASSGASIFAAGSSGYFRSTDGGVSFQKIVPAGLSSFAGFAGVAVAGSRVLAAPYFNVLASTDGGATFTPSNSGFDTTAFIDSIAASGSDVVLATSKGLFVSHDSGATWTKAPGAGFDVASASFAGGGHTLYLSRTDATTALLRTENFGQSLESVSNGLPQKVVNQVVSYTAPAGLAAEVAALASSTTLFAATGAGLYSSTDGAASWSRFGGDLGTIPVNALAISGNDLWVGTAGLGTRTYLLPPRTSRFVPIVLDVDTGSAHFTSELAITNRGTTTTSVTITYTAALGSGSGTVTETIGAGRQLTLPDVLTYLRQKGLPIPQGGSQGGTLLLTFYGVSSPDAVAATARTAAATASPQPVGRAGLAYSAIRPNEGSVGTLFLYGLRTTSTDRSNLAVYNVTAEPVTLQVKVFSGSGNGASSVVAAADTLPPYGWKQYNRVLDGPGFASGWASVTRVSTTGAFGAYAIINDNGTNDGSFVAPVRSGRFPAYLNVPVLVETPTFGSELVLASSADATATFVLTYRESLSGTATGSTTLTLPPKTQLIQANAIAFLRQRGIPIGAAGAASYAGSLHVSVSGVPAGSTFAGARTSSASRGGGQFGVFTPAFAAGSDQFEAGYVYGLRADASNRSNVAAVNTGGADAGSIVLSVQAFDGDAGGVPKGSAVSLTLAPGQWSQLSGFLGNQGVANGWVKLTRVSGAAPWIAYGVVNDGGSPGKATDDGAFVPFTP